MVRITVRVRVRVVIRVRIRVGIRVSVRVRVQVTAHILFTSDVAASVVLPHLSSPICLGSYRGLGYNA